MFKSAIFDAPDIICVSSKRPANMSLAYGDTRHSLANRRTFLERHKIDPGNLVCAEQVHGNRVAVIEAADRGRGAFDYASAIAQTDALLTNQREIALSVFTADCVPVFLFAPQASCIAAIHAGWRSTKERIAVLSLQCMGKHFAAHPGDVRVGFGACIRGCCYEVGAEFREYFPDCLQERAGRTYLDLVSVNAAQLIEAGVIPEHITDAGVCTACNVEEFFSYRKEGRACGRMMSLIMMKEPK
jgi:YfiH family protein